MIHKIISAILSANLELFGEAVLFKEGRAHLKNGPRLHMEIFILIKSVGNCATNLFHSETTVAAITNTPHHTRRIPILKVLFFFSRLIKDTFGFLYFNIKCVHFHFLL